MHPNNNLIHYGNLNSNDTIPDLLAIQLNSWHEFLQEDILPEKRENKGLESVFKHIFPVEDSRGDYILEYKSYYLGLPKYTEKECLERRISYNVPLKVKFVLHITDENNRSEYVQDIEQDVFFGNIPYMTKSGTFIINGAERVIVSQLQRSPGVFFDQNLHPNGTKIFQARIIPFRGSWVDFTTDIYDSIYAIIDRRRKFPVTMLLRALGYSTNTDIFNAFGTIKNLNPKKDEMSQYVGATVTEDIVDTHTGEIFLEGGSELSSDNIESLKEAGIESISVVNGNKDFHSMLLLNTIEKDPTNNTEEALAVVYQLIRSSEPPNLETAQKFIERIFFSPKKYDLGQVGRDRLNQQFNLNVPVEDTVLTMDDIIQVIYFLKTGLHHLL